MFDSMQSIEQSFEEFLAKETASISTEWFIINLLLSCILAIILRWVYIKYGSSLSNRRSFGNNFILITMTTMVIITIVKSSLALSLGLVGALSIIRFRAAIKEPEELTYLFLAISIGLGFGANQGNTIIIAFIIIVLVIILMKRVKYKTEDETNMLLTISTDSAQKLEIKQIVETLKVYCTELSLNRFDRTGEKIESTFTVKLDNIEDLNAVCNALREFDENFQFSYMNIRSL